MKPLFDVPDREQIRALVIEDQKKRELSMQQSVVPQVQEQPPDTGGFFDSLTKPWGAAKDMQPNVLQRTGSYAKEVVTQGAYQALSESRSDANKGFMDILGEEMGQTSMDPIDFLGATGRYLSSRYAAATYTPDENKAAAEAYQVDAAQASVKASQIPMTPQGERFQKDLYSRPQLPGVMGAGRAVKNFMQAFVNDPVGGAAMMAEVGARSAPLMALGVAASAITKNPEIGAAFMGLSDGAVERYTSPIDFLTSKGVDISDPQQIREAVRNDSLMAEAKRYGVDRAAFIAVTDWISGLAAGQELYTNPLGNMVAGASVQATLGGAGEFGAQAYTKGLNNIDWNDVTMEALAEFGTAPIEMVGVGRQYLDSKKAGTKTSVEDVLRNAAAGNKGAIATLKQAGFSDEEIGQMTTRRAGAPKAPATEEDTAPPPAAPAAFDDAQSQIDEVTKDAPAPGKLSFEELDANLKAEHQANLVAAGENNFLTGIEGVIQDVTSSTEVDPTSADTDYKMTLAEEFNRADVADYIATRAELHADIDGYLKGVSKEDAIAAAAKLRERADAIASGSEDMASRQNTSTPEFKAWFGDSKVVDEQGAPLVVYHGTASDFSSFRQDKAGTSIDSGFLGTGSYFTNKADTAGYYANVADRGQGGQNIMPVYASLQNPFMWGPKTQGVRALVMRGEPLPAAIHDKVIERTGFKFDPNAEPDPLDERMLSEAVTSVLKEMGYDGVIASSGNDPVAEVVAFDPTQIKSVNNRGTYDPNDPNIEAMAAKQKPPEVIPPGEPVPDEAVTVASLDSANTLSQSKVWQTGRDLKLALQEAILTAVNGANLRARTTANRAYLIKVGVKDALTALAQNANAIGWYDLKTRQALAVMSLVHPELATDETSRFAFTWALAVTSNGIKVGKNFELAEMVYSRWKASDKDPTKRRMPTDIRAGKAQGPINAALQTFNDLSQDWGLVPLRLFMLSNFKAGDIKAMTGIMPTGEWATTDVRGASIIGPKIGNGFFSNLYGKFDALTMDRWLVRTWGRWTGTLIEIDQPNVETSRARLTEALKVLDKTALAAALRDVKKTKTDKKGVTTVTEIKPGDRERLISALEGDDIDAIADAVLRASQEPKFRTAMNATSGGEELRKAGNNLAKYLDGQKEQPEGPGERIYIREIFAEMLKELQQDPRYKDLTMSDLQAVLWYAEKRLYETAKEDIVAEDIAKLEGDEVAGYDDEDAPDYANAAAAVARAKGVSDRRVNAALKKEENSGRSGTAQPAAGSSGPGGAAPAGAGQQGQARGLTESERREFVQRRALDRVRANRSSDAEQSWSYSRGSGSDGARPRLLKKLGKGVTAIADWTPGRGLKAVFTKAEVKTPTIHELAPGSAENAARFVSAITEARGTLGPIGEAVHVYPAEDYAGLRLFLTEDGTGGFALKPDGDIVSVFSAKGQGNGRAVMEVAVAAGGTKLDCFATVLPEFYSAHGFRATSRLLWNDEVAKENMPAWDKAAMAKFNHGEPDVVFMVFDPEYKGTYDRKATKLFDGDPEKDYGRALNAQTKAVREVARRPAAAPTTDTEAFIPRQMGQSVSGEPRRPSVGIPADGQTQEQLSLSKMSNNLVLLMNLIFRSGKVTAGKNALAQYNRKSGVIRSRQRNDFSSLVHESGHFLNDARGTELNRLINAYQNEITQIALQHYGAPQGLKPPQLKREGFAEFFRFYVTNPALAQQAAPGFYQAFDSLLRSTDPNMHKGLQALSAQAKAYAETYPSTDVVKSFIQPAKEKNLWDPRDLKDVIAEESQNARPHEGKATVGGFFDWVRRGMFDMGSKAYTALVDRNNGVRKLTYALLNTADANGKKIDLKDSQNPLELLAKAANSFLPAQLQLQYGVRPYGEVTARGPSLRDGIAVMMGADRGSSYFDMSKERMADANAYLVALRALTEYQRFLAGEITNPPVGFSEGDARQTVQDLEAKYGQSFKDGAKLVHQYARNLLDKEHDAGLISDETYDEIKDKPNYVPLLRDMSDKNKEFGSSVLTSGKSSIVKRFRGSSRDIIAPLDALMHRTFATEKRIAENDAIRSMAKLAEKAGRGAGAIVEKISAHELEQIQLKMEEVFQKIVDDPSISPADAAIMEGIFQASFGGDEVMSVFRSTVLNERGERILTYRDGGKLQAIQLGDDGIGEAVFNVMRGLGHDKVPLLLDLVSRPSRALRFGITKWPDFMLVNYFRDQFMASVSTNVGYVPFATGAKGMWDVVRKKKAFMDYSSAMGIMGGVAEYQIAKARTAKDIEGLKQRGYVVETFEFDGFSYKSLAGLVKGIFRLSELSEAGTRVGLFSKAYQRAIKEGLSEYDALQEASRIARDYMDFGRVGSKMAPANRLIPFLNANIQGLDVTIRKLGGGGAVGRKALAFMDENRTAPRIQAFAQMISAVTDGQRQKLNLSRVELNDLKNAQAMWVKMMGLALMSAALAFSYKDDPDYQEASEYLRQSGWLIPLGNGKLFYIPKPFEISVLGNLLERSIEYAYGDEKGLNKFWDSFLATVTPPFIPPAVSVPVGVFANLDLSFGQPREVTPGYMERLPPEQRALATTSEIAKKLGEALHYPPTKIDFMITSLFGSMGRDVSGMTDGILNPDRAEKGVDDSFITRRFIRDAARGGMSSQDFNELANQMNGAFTQASSGYKRFLDAGDAAGAADYLSQLTPDERAWAILDRSFDTKTKRMHPVYRANQMSTIISGMRREVLTTQLNDTSTDGETIPLTAKQKKNVDDFLTDIQRRERRNALIAIGHPSWKDKKPLPIEPSMELLREISPDAADELERRMAKAKVYDGADIAANWPELKQRLLEDGPDAILTDLTP